MYICYESMCKCEKHNLKKFMASMLRCLVGLSKWEIFHIKPQFCIMLQDLKQGCYLLGTPLLIMNSCTKDVNLQVTRCFISKKNC
jgi:hypothetical protein